VRDKDTIRHHRKLGLDEIGVATARLQALGGGGHEYGVEFVLQAVEMGEVLSGHLAAHLFPHTLPRVHLGAAGRQDNARDMLGDTERPGGRSTPAGENPDGKGVRMPCGNALEEALPLGRITPGEALDGARTGGRRHTAEPPPVGILMLHTIHRLAPTDGATTAPNGQQSPAAFILTPPAERSSVVRGKTLAHLRSQRIAEGGLIFRGCCYGADGRPWGWS
jgi:hypothetical protein